MSMFKIIGIVEKLEITYGVRVFWKVASNPLEVKLLVNDSDVLEMVRNIPTDHYVHLFLEEIVGFAVPEPEPEPEPELNSGDDNVAFEAEGRVDSESDSEDEDYGAQSESTTDVSKFSNSEDEFFSSDDEINNVNVGLGSEEVEVESDGEHSDSLHSVDESDSDGPQHRPRFPEFNADTDMLNPILKVSLIFTSKDILKEAIRMYSVKNRYNVKLKRNDNKRIQVTCKEGCPWVLWATPINGEDPSRGTWQIRSVKGEHNCLREFVNANVTSRWLARKYLNNFYVDPTFSSTSLKHVVHKDWGLTVAKGKCIRARNFALEMMHENQNEQYAKLYGYLGELRYSNLGTTTICKLDERKFERVYVCMQAMKEEFKAGCRPIIGLDGCHLKGYYLGHLLAAVGIDADDSIYPVAFAVIESECESAWCWFLKILAADLKINNSHMFTFMTDRQKGLMDAVPELFPYAEHRTCVRHLYSNSKTNDFVEKALKDQLWKAARATYVREFESAMSNLKDLSETVWKWLAPKDPRMWSKSHFSINCKSDMLLNNNCECFNKLILEARDKPVITLLELVRTKLMQRLAKRKELAEKWNELLCSKIQKKLDHATSLAHSCWPIYAGGHMYQVSCGPSNQHAVNIQAWTCSCRKWELTGIPCVHAISVILSLPDRPEKYVAPCYHVST
ncbi:hypothetical protein HRI_001820600 [Hibiscus trionum]|uniref:SWIM-type domain-containing protein n=1 Tax=Hibiscus trionum TaxID=183268 RepID=A0A9W7LYY9_HIBTR|nr:hypothetical protein HRI_001820600 [Hibiscus trionum]